jgi:2-C-methyl-D-erythritol 4-phosphate cytidylyltransferase
VSVGCVIPAAGRGERLGGAVPKALRKLAGVTLLEHSIRAMAAARAVQHIVVAAPADHLEQVSQVVNDIELTTHMAIVTGGATRAESVSNAVAALPSQSSIVLVQDAARPLVPLEVVEAVISACQAGAPAVVPVIPVSDTIKQVDAAGRIVGTVDRSELRAAQTPQAFLRQTLTAALAQPHAGATDDASLAERNGATILAVPGHFESLKITRPFDLMIAETILRRRQADRSG